MRTFIAVELSDAIRERLGLAQERLRGRHSGVKWVDPKQIHLTLKFLGEIEEGAVGEVAAIVAAAALGVAPFDIHVAGLGAFPPRGAPRVIWAGVEDSSGSLPLLSGRLDRDLERLGIERESRPFQSHVTLGRAKDPRAARPLREQIDAQGAVEFGVQTVEEIVVFRSVLSPQGPTYTALRRQRLG